jgi:hypothetical protein
LKSSIQKSRPYFEEKQICQEQLQTQKERIQQIQGMLQKAKSNYAASLKSLEMISESIHKKRGDLSCISYLGKKESGVGAEAKHNIYGNETETKQLVPSFILSQCDSEPLSSNSLDTNSALKSTINIKKFDDVDALRMKVYYGFSFLKKSNY